MTPDKKNVDRLDDACVYLYKESRLVLERVCSDLQGENNGYFKNELK